jgi:hypothetical protein
VGLAESDDKRTAACKRVNLLPDLQGDGSSTMIPIAHGQLIARQPQIQRVTTIAHAHLEALNLLRQL